MTQIHLTAAAAKYLLDPESNYSGVMTFGPDEA
jgi:hypothetical protein